MAKLQKPESNGYVNHTVCAIVGSQLHYTILYLADSKEFRICIFDPIFVPLSLGFALKFELKKGKNSLINCLF